jgi:hypothetical protein
MKSLREREFDELEGKSGAAKKPDSYCDKVRSAKMWLKNVYKNNPSLFAYWRFGVKP